MITRNVIGLGTITIPLLLMTLVGQSAPGVWTGVGSLPKKHIVEITAFEFIPNQLEVSIGDTVVWVNNDVVPHTATAVNKSWNTDFIGDSEESIFIVIKKVGEQDYLCLYHPSMKGTINAKASSD